MKTKSLEGTCKLCNKQAKLVNAHVIPNSFYKLMFDSNGHARLMTSVSGEYGRNLGTGIYDPNLVCEECERSFSKYDKYGKEFLLDTEWDSLPHLPNRPNAQAYLVESYDWKLLKLFFLTVLWRIAATSRREFRAIDLGPFIHGLKEAVQAENPGDINQWSVFIGRFAEPPSNNTVLNPRLAWLDPHRTRFRGVNCIKLYMADIIVYIKVDRRNFEPIMELFCISDTGPLIVMKRDFQKSKELVLLAKMAREGN